jgi:hypothetical protein
MARNKRNVCITLTGGFKVRIGLRRNCGRHPAKTFSRSSLKTIARFEATRLQRNAPRPAPVVDQVMTSVAFGVEIEDDEGDAEQRLQKPLQNVQRQSRIIDSARLQTGIHFLEKRLRILGAH